MQAKVSVIVCARNEEKVIGACLEALKRQTACPEIIVIDGHSTDRTREIAKKHADKVILDNGKGIGDARNIGWKAATHGIVAFCDADARPPPDWVENIGKLIDDNAAVNGPLVPYDAHRFRTKLTMKIWTDIFLRAGSAVRYPIVCAANVAFRKSMLEKYPFRLNAPTEDFDVGRRMRHAGRIRFFSELRMPISGRRFENKFYRRTAVIYLRNYFRVTVGKEAKDFGYFENKG